jgi:tRNA(fMet)-specific endonuclease VapC
VEVKRLALDTSAYSHFRGNHAEVVDRIARADVVYLPAIVLGELEAAFRKGARTADNRAKLEDFLDEDFVQVLPVTADVARGYGQLFAALRAAGTPIPVNDIWIAATAIDAGAHLLTFDRDFDHVTRLDRTILRP